MLCWVIYDHWKGKSRSKHVNWLLFLPHIDFSEKCIYFIWRYPAGLSDQLFFHDHKVSLIRHQFIFSFSLLFLMFLLFCPGFLEMANHELPDVQAGFRKGRRARDQIANICWIIKKAREFQKNIYFCFLTMPKFLTVWITRNCGKFLKRRAYHLTSSLRNL